MTRDLSELYRLFTAVKRMREFQRGYFQYRTSEWLEKSKAAEREVDRLIEELEGAQQSMEV